MKKEIRLYADTSVYGGVFDDEFSETSLLFFKQIRIGRFKLVSSDVVSQELQEAPLKVRALFQEYLSDIEIVEITTEALELQHAYIAEGIVPQKAYGDALHVALSTTAGCDGIISWNFKHIVNFQKIPLYNAVNVLHGFNTIFIHSPLEVVNYEN